MTTTVGNESDAPPRVFLSYSHTDLAVAKEIAHALGEANIPVWPDSWGPEIGESIVDQIRERLAASDFLVILLSPESLHSPWVREEVDLALATELRQRHITVVPAILRDCELPSGLRTFLPVDLRDYGAAGISKLVERISLAIDIDFSRLNPRRFEELVADVFRAEGFTVQISMATRDGGHDLVLLSPAHGSEGTPAVYAVQVKHYKERRVSVETIRTAVGSAVLAGAKGVIVSSTQLTSAAKELVADVNRKGILELQVIDGPDLERKVLDHPDLANKYFRAGSQT